MTVLCFILLLLCLGLLWRFTVQNRQIQKVKEQIDFLCKRDTQTEIMSEKTDRNMQELTVSINRLLEKYRYTGQQIEKNDALFRDTITSLSHDLRTPLATANGYIQLLRDQELSSEQKEYLGIAEERITAVKLLLDQLFEFARIEANELKLNCQNVDINSILRDASAAYYSDFEKKESIPDIIIPDNPTVIWGDKDALTRIFSNIICNALVHGNGKYKISSAINEKQSVVIFSNETNTIRPEDLSHLFDRFYTTDQSRTRKTTGLGLAIAYKLTLRMGGTIFAHLNDEIFEITISFPIIMI